MNTLAIKTISECNLRCGMCPFHGDGYETDYFKERPENKRVMTLDEIEIILKKARDHGVERINFTPEGEFFLYKKWREALELVSKYGMQSMVATNGTLLEEQDIKDAVDLGLRYAIVSIDSVHYDTYKIVRKPASKKAFENAINAPILFNQYGKAKYKSNDVKERFYTHINFVEQLENEKEIDSVLEFYLPYDIPQITLLKCITAAENNLRLVKRERESYYNAASCLHYNAASVVEPDGSVLACCGQQYFYHKMKDEIPNIFRLSIEECEKQQNLNFKNEVFVDFCKNCHLYDSVGENAHVKKIANGYFGVESHYHTNYFPIPKFLRNIPSEILLFMYSKQMVKEIKLFMQSKNIS